MPSVQSLAQTYSVIWTCDEGKPYREKDAPGLLCPSRPENLPFLKGLYKDLIAMFRYSPYLGVGCSEVEMQWQGHFCPLCKKRIDAGETVHDIHSVHVARCARGGHRGRQGNRSPGTSGHVGRRVLLRLRRQTLDRN